MGDCGRFLRTIGFLISGQDLRLSLQSSFSLAQIGEFAFIIAALGLTSVYQSFLYPDGGGRFGDYHLYNAFRN